RNAHGFVAIVIQRVVDEGRIQRDITVIAHEQPRLLPAQLIQTRHGELIGAALDHPIHVTFDHRLQAAHVVYRTQLAPQNPAHQKADNNGKSGGIFRQPDTPERQCKFIVAEQAIEYRADFAIAVRADIRKLISHLAIRTLKGVSDRWARETLPDRVRSVIFWMNIPGRINNYRIGLTHPEAIRKMRLLRCSDQTSTYGFKAINCL